MALEWARRSLARLRWNIRRPRSAAATSRPRRETAAQLSTTLAPMPPDDMEQRLRAFFAADARGALAAYLFGSFARGTARSHSDVDVGVLYGAAPPSALDAPHFELEAELERSLGRDVQVIVLDTA